MTTIDPTTPGPSLVPPDMLAKVAGPAPEPEPEAPAGAEPEGDEQGEAIVFVRTGWIRFTVGGRLYRLRPPFLKEVKRLRFALEEMADNLADLQSEVEVAGIEILEEQARLEEKADLSATERVAARSALRKRSRDAARSLNERREAETLAWFRLAFEVLCVDDVTAWLGDFDDFPAWATSGLLPHQMLRHWRAAPLAPGR